MFDPAARGSISRDLDPRYARAAPQSRAGKGVHARKDYDATAEDDSRRAANDILPGVSAGTRS